HFFEAPKMTYPYGTHVAGVEVDPATGRVTLRKYVVTYDVGRAINPMIVGGQIVGGLAQGLGGALFEELVYDDQGQPLTTTFMDYLVPTAMEMPEATIVKILEETPTPLNPLGVKGVGERGSSHAAGRPIQPIIEIQDGKSAVSQAKLRKLVPQKHVLVLTRVLLSLIGLGMLPPIERDQLMTLYLTTPDDLTKKNVSKFILRTMFAASQPMHPLGDYAARVLKYKRVVTIAMDNPFGHEQIGGFQRVFEDQGGRVVQ